MSNGMIQRGPSTSLDDEEDAPSPSTSPSSSSSHKSKSKPKSTIYHQQQQQQQQQRQQREYQPPRHRPAKRRLCVHMNGMKCLVLVVLCLQNSVYTVLRRYSQGVLKETYSKHEVLLLGEILKMIFSLWRISLNLPSSLPLHTHHASSPTTTISPKTTLTSHMVHLLRHSRKMLFLAFLYAAMNILSFIALRHISAAVFVILAQCKIVTTAAFSAWMLNRKYSSAKWRALCQLLIGVVMFSAPRGMLQGTTTTTTTSAAADSAAASVASTTTMNAMVLLGITAVLLEVTLSGFSSIYFEKVIKTDAMADSFNIWERNFQLSFGSVFMYSSMMFLDPPASSKHFSGWSPMALLISLLGAAGGLLVALSIKYGDSILKTMAIAGSILLAAGVECVWLDGPLDGGMVLAGMQVVLGICNYTLDATPAVVVDKKKEEEEEGGEEKKTLSLSSSSVSSSPTRGLRERNG